MNFIDSLFTKFFDSKFLARIFAPAERALDSDNFYTIFLRILVGLLAILYVIGWIMTISAIFSYGLVGSGLIFAGILIFIFFFARWSYFNIFATSKSTSL